MAGEDLFGQNLQNPFENLGLNREAVQALNDLRDPEAIKTVVGGLYRAFSRVLHPDASHPGSARSEDFFNELVQAANDIDHSDGSAVATFAADFAKTKQRSAKKAAAPAKTEVRPDDHGPEIMRQLAMASLSELGPSFPPTSRIFINNYTYQYEESYWASFRRTGDETVAVTPYQHRDLPEVEKTRGWKQTENDPLVAESLPWEQLVSPSRRALSSFLMDATVEVTEGQPAMLRDESGRTVEADLSPLINGHSMHRPGIYTVRANFSRKPHGPDEDEPSLDKAFLVRYYYAPTRQPEEFEMRLLGSAHGRFRSELNKIMRHYTMGASPAAELPNVYRPDLAQKRLYTYANDLGHKIPENFYYLLGRYFTPRVLSDNLLVTAADGEIYIPGKIAGIYR